MRLLFFAILIHLGFSFATAQITDTLNFENYYPTSNNSVIVIDSIDGIWQVGKPNKTIFHSSLSLENAAVTDTLNNYPTNNDSYFYFHINKQMSLDIGTGNGYAGLEFYLNLNTDSISDYGTIEYFYGSQWNLVSNNSFNSNYSFNYDWNFDFPVDKNNSAKFTGNSSGWQFCRLNIQCYTVFAPDHEQRGASNDLLFRFHFHSDSNNTNKEGWMIDNLIFENFNGPCIGGFNESENQLNLSASPTLTNGNISFETETELFSKISIYDFSGKLIENFSFIQTNFKTLELSNLSNGMYFYSVEDGKATGKFMMEK